MFRCNPSPSEPQDHPQGVDHGIGIHPIKRYEGAHLFRPQDQNMHTLPLDIPLGYRDVSVFPSKIEGKLISVMGAFEVSRFPRGKDVESMVSAGQVHDHSLGCPVVGVKGLLVRVLLLVDGQVTSSHRERTQVEYPVKGFPVSKGVLKQEGMYPSPRPVGHLFSQGPPGSHEHEKKQQTPNDRKPFFHPPPSRPTGPKRPCRSAELTFGSRLEKEERVFRRGPGVSWDTTLTPRVRARKSEWSSPSSWCFRL
jgi:hypothetical protein